MNASKLFDLAHALGVIERRIFNNQAYGIIVHSDDNKAHEYRSAINDQDLQTIRDAHAMAAEGSKEQGILEDAMLSFAMRSDREG